MKPIRKRIQEIVKILRREYPKSTAALKHRSAFELLVSTILSAQCTDERVNRITPALFRKYRSPRDFARTSQVRLEKEIYSTGFYKSKARNIIGAAKRIVAEFGGNVPDSMEKLVSLPGVARKTANIVLSASFGKAEGIAVDTHVKRLSGKIGLSSKKDPAGIEKDLMALLPEKDWLDFNYLLVDHGRKICTARNPLCPECVIENFCAFFKKTKSSERKNKNR